MVNVNGPINMVRLEGSGKVLYVIMDIHKSPMDQHECPDEDSIDLHHYLKKQFEKSKETGTHYDFFLEIYPSDISKNYQSLLSRKLIYILQTRKFFIRNLKIDEKLDKVLQVPKLPHIRFHYIDPRDYFSIGTSLNITAWSNNMKIFGNSMFPMLLESVLMKFFYSAATEAKKWVELLENRHELKVSKPSTMIPKKGKKMDPKVYLEMRMYLVDKIFNRYNNKQTKETISRIAESETIPFLKKLISLLEKLVSKCHNYLKTTNKKFDLTLQQNGTYFYGVDPRIKEEMVTNMYVLALDCFEVVIRFQSQLMDLFFLRRFLDKGYITNGIVYTGANHSSFYVYALVKYFGFQITHSAYVEKKDNLEEIVKKAKHSRELSKLFFPPKLTQCVHTHDFPELFQ